MKQISNHRFCNSKNINEKHQMPNTKPKRVRHKKIEEKNEEESISCNIFALIGILILLLAVPELSMGYKSILSILYLLSGLHFTNKKGE